MAVIKCKMCGGDLVIESGATVAECEYCGTRQTIPNQDDEKKLTLFARANWLRMGCEFDKAAGIYESIVADFPQEAEAYWGLVLCKYGIEYVGDPATGKKIPTCHRSSFESIMEDSDFEQALENADVVARRVYREEAKQIEEIRKGIIEVSGKEDPYDIFICYKETDENGQRTVDSVIAQDVYDALTEKGYRVFFSRITLEDKLGQEYEPYIFAALNSAKIMLAFGTDYEYYNAVWVKNEWSRYLKLMAKDKSKHLIPCYKGIDAYDMPGEFAKLQAQDMGKVGAIQDLMRGIEKLLPRTDPSAAPVQQVVPQVVTGATQADSLIKRGYISLEDGAFDEANKFFNEALNSSPESAEAYLGLYMAEIKAKKTSEAGSKFVAAQNVNSRFFLRAKQFASGALLAEIQSWEKTREERLQRDAEEARKKKEAEAAKQRAKVEKVASIRKRLHSGVLEMTAAQKAEQERLEKAAQQAKAEADRAEQFYKTMPEQEEHQRLQQEISNKQQYLSTLGFFKGKEKKIVQAEIDALNAKIPMIEKKLDEAKQNVAQCCGEVEKTEQQIAAFKSDLPNQQRENLVEELLAAWVGTEEIVGSSVEYGAYPQTRNGSDTTPIEWLVLAREGTRLLLISRYALDYQKYNSKRGRVTWEQSSIRSWLNSTFLNKAFTGAEQTTIQTTTVTADKHPFPGVDPGNDTQDKVFLLNTDEVRQYFKDKNARKCVATDYAKANGTGMRGGICRWWLRSTGKYASQAAIVFDDDPVFGGGAIDGWGFDVDIGLYIRPAMWVEIDS